MSLDGSTFAPPALPAPAGAPSAFYPPPGTQPQPGGAAVGRPAADPLVQEQRNTRYAEDKRIRSMLSKSVDSKIYLFPMKGGRVKAGAKATLKVLFRDVEKWISETGDAANAETNDYLKELLTAKGVIDGCYQCMVYDQHNKRNPAYPPWELQLGEEEEETTAEDDDDLDTGLDFMRDRGSMGPDPYAAPIPPPPPPIDPLAIARTIDQGRADESKKSEGMMTVMMTVLQTMNQQQMTAQQNAISQQNAMMEREAARRSDTLKAIIAAVPLVLPMIIGLFKKEDKPDKAMEMIIELLKAQFGQKPETAVMFEQMSKLMNTSMESTMRAQSEMTANMSKLQLEGSAQTAKIQGEVQGVIISNLMKNVKEMMNERTAPAKEPSMIETIGAIAGPIIAGMQQQKAAETQAAAAQAAANPGQAQPPVVQRAPLPPPVPARGGKRAPPPPAQRAPQQQNPENFTPEARIGGCLKTVMQLHAGRIAPQKYWNVVDWVSKNLPEDMLTVVKNKDEVNIMIKGTPVVELKGNEALKGWFNDPQGVEFLRLFLTDVADHVNGVMTEAIAAVRVTNHIEVIKKKMETVGANGAAATTAAMAAPVAEVVSNPSNPANDPANPQTPAPAGEAAPAGQAPGKKRPPPKKDNGLI